MARRSELAGCQINLLDFNSKFFGHFPSCFSALGAVLDRANASLRPVKRYDKCRHDVLHFVAHNNWRPPWRRQPNCGMYSAIKTKNRSLRDRARRRHQRYPLNDRDFGTSRTGSYRIKLHPLPGRAEGGAMTTHGPERHLVRCSDLVDFRGIADIAPPSQFGRS